MRCTGPPLPVVQRRSGAFSCVTARRGWIEWHFLSADTILARLDLAISWWITGRDTARFSSLVHVPKVSLSHRAHRMQGKTGDEARQHAAGNLPVLFGSMLFQAEAGLFSGDDILVAGPRPSSRVKR